MDKEQEIEQEQSREEEQGNWTGRNTPLVQVDIHPPGSPGLGIRNRGLFEHVTVRKESRHA